MIHECRREVFETGSALVAPIRLFEDGHALPARRF